MVHQLFAVPVIDVISLLLSCCCCCYSEDSFHTHRGKTALILLKTYVHPNTFWGITPFPLKYPPYSRELPLYVELFAKKFHEFCCEIFCLPRNLLCWKFCMVHSYLDWNPSQWIMNSRFEGSNEFPWFESNRTKWNSIFSVIIAEHLIVSVCVMSSYNKVINSHRELIHSLS